ncbi:MAG TPA: Hsp20/alpha crystallin family protein [Kribbellaceae bacterium]
MSTLARRERGTFADLFDWLEAELPFPVMRPFSGGQMMRVEEYTEAGQYVLRAELPGLDPDKDIDIEVRDGVLTVKAERREETRSGHRSEFRYGSFSRSVTLPSNADEDDVRASYRDGILEVRVGITEAKTSEAKHIHVDKS